MFRRQHRMSDGYASPPERSIAPPAMAPISNAEAILALGYTKSPATLGYEGQNLEAAVAAALSPDGSLGYANDPEVLAALNARGAAARLGYDLTPVAALIPDGSLGYANDPAVLAALDAQGAAARLGYDLSPAVTIPYWNDPAFLAETDRQAAAAELRKRYDQSPKRRYDTLADLSGGGSALAEAFPAHDRPTRRS